ncbi:MAG: C40 family peptidase [Nocardioidaceae bacterium]
MTHLSVAVPISTLWSAPNAPREVDGPAISATPDIYTWCKAMSTEDRRGLHGRTLSQLLMGEPVEVTEESAGWVRVKAPWQPSSAGLPADSEFAGYPGWLPRSHLAARADPPDGHGQAVVTARTTLLRIGVEASSATGREAGATVAISWATTLPVLAVTDTEVHVALPGGRRGVLEAADVRVRPAGTVPAVTGEAALASARRMLGTGYLWGGTSGWGVDCSGLVHLAFRGHGWVVPRDAHDQQAAATDVAPDRARPGDLYFFGAAGEVSHVGLFSGDDQMLHAPQTGELVEEETLDPDRLRGLTGVGRFGSGGAAHLVKTR